MTGLRGARSQIQGRFEAEVRSPFDDGWAREDGGESPPLATTVTVERARSIIARNDSPDVPFDRSINPYRGCEHGCIYCYARPSHAYLELSPGLDFETRLYAKTNAVELLRKELARPGYRAQPMAFGTNTDCYQPVERRHRIMRGLLQVLAECGHPLTIVTKSALIERDLDLLAPMARRNLVKAFVSITTLDARLARTLEPRAASPRRRVDALRALAAAGVPCGVMVAPLIPALTDPSLEAVLEAAAGAGATMAGWILLRLPNEVRPLFKEWLAAHHPQRADHVISLVRQSRGGRENDPNFGSRMTGSGNFAELIGRRFELACRRLGLNREDDHLASRGGLDCTQFRPPVPDAAAAGASGQLALF
jgi:DNA repair photolyase